jgi:hypothetical protein
MASPSPHPASASSWSAAVPSLQAASAASTASAAAASSPSSLPPLFCDLDGVLADFDRGVLRLTGRPFPVKPEPAGPVWRVLARAPEPGFFASLEMMPDAPVLWRAIAPHRPVILTGCPGGGWAPGQKRAWCARHLGAHVEVITCMAQDKAEQAAAWVGRRGAGEAAGGGAAGAAGSGSGSGSAPSIGVLIDDMLKAKEPWERAGGTFILHTSAETTIARLRALGYAGEV